MQATKAGKKAGREWQSNYDRTGGQCAPQITVAPYNSVELSNEWATGFIDGAGRTDEARKAVAALLLEPIRVIVGDRIAAFSR